MNQFFKSNKVLLLVTILTFISLSITSISIWIDFTISTKSLKSNLLDIAEGEKALIETLFKNSFTKEAILDILKEKNQTKQSIGKTGEFAIAQMENDTINFILRKDFHGNVKNKKIYAGLNIAEPIKLALQGKNGSLKGIDYNGNDVFAGFTYFEPFKWGIVAKIRTEEVYKPYLISYAITILFGIIFIALGAILFIRITNPMIESIVKNEENLSITLNSIGDAVISTDESGLVVGMNPIAEYLCGWSFDKAKGKQLSEIFNIINAETRLPVINPVKKVIETGEVIGLANHTILISKNGKEYQIADSASPIKNNQGKIKGVVLVFSDVTKVYAAQKELLKSEYRFRSTLDNMMEGCQIIGFDWRYIYLNNAAEAHYRRSNSELINKNYMEMWPGIENTKVFELMKKCMSERKHQNLVYEFEYPDGTKNWFELSIQPVPEGIFIHSININERKYAEEETIRLNRIYSLLSNVNQSIIRIRDIKVLFDEICRITIECGKFRMAWIGMYNSELNTIEVKSSYGMIKGYLDDFYIDLNNENSSSGPSGQTFKSGTFTISNDILNDERMLPWRENALQNGYKSSAAFPLKIFGKTVGTLNIYSEEIDFFNESEIDLLEEMSLDISFALEFIKHETERKLTEVILENERIRLRTLIETIPDLIWLKNPDGIFITCNPRFENLIGATESEIIGKTDYDFLPKEVADFFRLKDKEAQKENKPTINHEWVTFKNDGHKEFLETIKTPMYDSIGQLIGILGISRNITEQQQTLEDLRLLSERFRVSLKNSDIVVAITNKELRYEWIYNTHPNFNAEKVIGLRDDEIAQNEGAGILIQMKQSILDSGKGMRKEIAFLNNNVEEIYDITGEPLYDAAGKIIGITTASLNITEHKKVELELIRAREKAEESDRLKSNFLANMSHELRTPMVGILGFSQLLLMADNFEEVIEMSEIILSSSKRLMETLNLILDLSSIEAGEAGLELTDFDVLKEIKKSIKFFNHAALKKNLQIIFNCNQNSFIIHSSKKAVESILNNLISNAIKFTNEGSISISVNSECVELIDYINLEVIDTGIGIEEKNFEHVFEEFRQVSEGFGRSHEGAGLGLTLIKKYVDILKGTISIRSKINVGTTFSVKLPVQAILSDEITENFDKIYEQKENLTEISNRETKKILVVEDDEISRYLVKKYLIDICSVDFAFNAIEAIEKAENYRYDAILMDINLGKSENGIFATQQIRNIDKYLDIPIIAMTAYAMKGDKEEFLAGGCSHYISKPFDKDEFLKLICDVLKININLI